MNSKHDFTELELVDINSKRAVFNVHGARQLFTSPLHGTSIVLDYTSTIVSLLGTAVSKDRNNQ